jgi:hypothetical protein
LIFAAQTSSLAVPGENLAEAGLEACLGQDPQTVLVTYQPGDGTFATASGKVFFASDLHVPQQGAGQLPGPTGEGESSGAILEAVQIGPENRWGEAPAWILTGTAETRRFLQAWQLEQGLAFFAPVHAENHCADALRKAEELARHARAGAWGRAEPRLILPANAPEQFAQMAGRYVIARGRVVSLGKTRDTRYLNFGKYWKTDFTVTLNSADEEAFNAALGRSGRTLDTLAGELVELRGFVQDRDGPLMALRYPEQLVVLDE